MGWNNNLVRVSKRIAKADLSKNSLDWQPSPIDRWIHNKYIDIRDWKEFILLITAEISAPFAHACVPSEMLSAAEICIRSPALLPALTMQSKWSSHSALQKIFLPELGKRPSTPCYGFQSASNTRFGRIPIKIRSWQIGFVLKGICLISG